jgi:hypothetical protein
MARLLPSTSWMRLRVDPPLTPAESLETTRIYSAMGLLKPGQPSTPVLGRPGFSGTPPDGRPATMRFASWGSDRPGGQTEEQAISTTPYVTARLHNRSINAEFRIGQLEAGQQGKKLVPRSDPRETPPNKELQRCKRQKCSSVPWTLS